MAVTIEEFNTVCCERTHDLMLLKPSDRRIFIMHIGGIVIECLIKFVIVKYYGITMREGISNWICSKNTTSLGTNILQNPSHKLFKGIERVDPLFQKVDKNIKDLIDILQKPAGIEYIDLRYYCGTISNTQFTEWENAYIAIRKWLIKNLGII